MHLLGRSPSWAEHGACAARQSDGPRVLGRLAFRRLGPRAAWHRKVGIIEIIEQVRRRRGLGRGRWRAGCALDRRLIFLVFHVAQSLIEVLRRGALRAALGLARLERHLQLAQLIGHALVLGACLVERARHVADVLVGLADLPLGVGASCGGRFLGECRASNGLGALALGRSDAFVDAGGLCLVCLVELLRSSVEGVLLRLEAILDVREMLLAVPKGCVLALDALSVCAESLLVALAALFAGMDVSRALVERVHALGEVAREAIGMDDCVVECVHRCLEGVSCLVLQGGGKGGGGA